VMAIEQAAREFLAQTFGWPRAIVPFIVLTF
jgi:hypothetical protein